MQNVTYKHEIITPFFINVQHVKIITTLHKKYQETCKNLFGIFHKVFGMARGAVSSTGGEYSKTGTTRRRQMGFEQACRVMGMELGRLDPWVGGLWVKIMGHGLGLDQMKGVYICFLKETDVVFLLHLS
jgi:hypothetical protein